MTTKNHNAHCEEISRTFEAYADGFGIICPECGARLLGDFSEDEEHTCPECAEAVDFDYAETLSPWHWLEDALDIEYTVAGNRRDILGARILVAFGGPNIWVDTRAAEVTLRGWNESGRASLSIDACATFNEYISELYHCG